MEAKFSRRLVVSIVGVLIVLGLALGGYFVIAGPRMKEWKEARKEINERRKRLKELKKAFSNQNDPRVELKTLQQEIKNLKKATSALDSIKKAGVETKDLPKELKDPDPAIRKELYRDYIKEVMSATEENMKENLKNAGIASPDMKLYTQLSDALEATYYMNRAGGLQGIINSMVKTQSEGSTIVFDGLVLEDYKKGRKRREGAVNVISYFLEMTMDTESLMSLLYNLQEEDGFYYVHELRLEPVGKGRSRFGSGRSRIDSGRSMLGTTGSQFGASDEKLKVTARIDTILVFKSEVKKQVAKAAAKTFAKRGTKKQKIGGGLLGLFAGMKKQIEKEKQKQASKKWYEFWK